MSAVMVRHHQDRLTKWHIQHLAIFYKVPANPSVLTCTSEDAFVTLVITQWSSSWMISVSKYKFAPLSHRPAERKRDCMITFRIWSGIIWSVFIWSGLALTDLLRWYLVWFGISFSGFEVFGLFLYHLVWSVINGHYLTLASPSFHISSLAYTPFSSLPFPLLHFPPLTLPPLVFPFLLFTSLLFIDVSFHQLNLIKLP